MIISFDGKIGGGGNSLQQKKVAITQNGLDVIIPDNEYDGLSAVYVFTDVSNGGGESSDKDFSSLGYDEIDNVVVNQLIVKSIEKDIEDSKDANPNTCVYLPTTATATTFSDWVNLQYIPNGYDMGVVDDLYFENCYSLRKLDFNLINCSVEDIDNDGLSHTSFKNCYKLEEVVFSKNMFKAESTVAVEMFLNNTSLKTLDFTDSGFRPLSLEYFAKNSAIETITGLDTSSCVEFTGAFGYSNTKQLCKLSLASLTSHSNVLVHMLNESLNVFGGFIDTEQITNWGRASTNPFYYATNLETIEEMGVINGTNFSVSHCEKLTIDSLMVIINALFDCVGNGETTTKNCTIGEVNLAKLTEEQIAVATSKGWILK